MKYFLVLALVFSIFGRTLSANKEKADEQQDQAIITACAYVVGKTCGPITGLVLLEMTNKLKEKLNDEKDLSKAFTVAIEAGLRSAGTIFKKVSDAAAFGADISKEIQKGGDPLKTVMDETKDVAKRLMSEFIKNPHGNVIKSAITGSNIALTWTIGPVPAWFTASIAKAAADAVEQFKKTGNFTEATQIAVKSGYHSGKLLFESARGFINSAATLYKDFQEGKNTMGQIKDFGNKALKNNVKSFKSQ